MIGLAKQGDQVEAFNVALYSSIATRIRSIPSKAAPVVSLGSVAEIEAMLRRHVDGALEAVADDRLK